MKRNDVIILVSLVALAICAMVVAYNSKLKPKAQITIPPLAESTSYPTIPVQSEVKFQEGILLPKSQLFKVEDNKVVADGSLKIKNVYLRCIILTSIFEKKRYLLVQSTEHDYRSDIYLVLEKDVFVPDTKRLPERRSSPLTPSDLRP